VTTEKVIVNAADMTPVNTVAERKFTDCLKNRISRKNGQVTEQPSKHVPK